MNEKDLLTSLNEDGEYYFLDGSVRYLLYLWQQCDGVLLNLCRQDDDSQILWQTSGKSIKKCADEFIKSYRHNELQNV